MRLFDLHCDTIIECYKQKVPLRENRLQIDLVRGGRAYERWAQLFAICPPDTLRGQDARDFFDTRYRLFADEMARNEDLAVWVKYPQGYVHPADDPRMTAILTVENGCVLAGDLHQIPRLSALGVRLITLTWNADNEIASGILGSGGGLTDFGREAVRLMEEEQIALDVSHLGEHSFWELYDRTEGPIVASHSNARFRCRHPRNLTDEQFKAIAARGGIVGFNLCVPFITPWDHEPFGGNWYADYSCPMEEIVGMIEYMWSLGGEDTLCMGSDFDGSPITRELNAIDKLPTLYDALKARGHDDELLDKFFYRNAWDFFTRA